MPVTTPQGTQYTGIDPNRTGKFAFWPVTDQPSSRRREHKKARERWFRARRAEKHYARQLRRIARHVGDIVRGVFNPWDPHDPGWTHVISALNDYGRLIAPWAGAVSRRMIADVSQRDWKAWLDHGREIGHALHKLISTAPIQGELAAAQTSQITLITSIPYNAAQRVHQLSQEAMVRGRRWEEIAKDVMNQHQVSRSQANTIARTETARVSTNLNRIRAEHIGVDQFIWRTAMDKDVRPLHAKYEGRVFTWTNPPRLDDGRPGLPGTIYNCRCWAEPVIPDFPEE